MEQILVAIDGSTSSREAVQLALELAEQHEAHVTFVRVVSDPPLDSDREPLEAAVDLASERELEAEKTLLVGHVVDEIVAHAEMLDVDLIVIGSRGRGNLTGTLLGSVSQGVLHQAMRPVLVARGRQTTSRNNRLTDAYTTAGPERDRCRARPRRGGLRRQ